MRGRNFTDCIDLRELTNVVLFVQESSSSRRCASYCGGGREFPHTLVYTVPGRWLIGGVCGVGGEHIRVLGGMGVREQSLVVYFLVCVQIYQIPQFKLVFSVRNFSSAPKTLMDSGPTPLQT